MAVKQSFSLWSSLQRPLLSSLSPSPSPSRFPLSHSLFVVGERERHLRWNTLAVEGKGEEEGGFDNRQIQRLGQEVYSHLNTVGLRYPVVRPSEDLVKPSGFVVPSPDRCKEYPFYISRTKSFNLPVYMDIKKSGRCLTILRRIAGSMDAIESELQKFIPRDRIIRKEGHFKIKGHYTKVLRGWLYGLGF